MKARLSWVAIVPDVLGFMLVIGLFTIWRKIAIILSTKLEITDTMIIGKKGIIKTESMESPINKVTSVKVNQGFFGKLFKYGDIYINTPSGEYSFQCLANAEEVKNYIVNKMK